MGVWVYGCMDAWVYGCKDAWVYRCVGVWVFGWANPANKTTHTNACTGQMEWWWLRLRVRDRMEVVACLLKVRRRVNP